MKKHKIRNVDIEVCCCEQKIAYNFLFAWGHMKVDDLIRMTSGSIDENKKLKRYDKQLIIELIKKSYDRYKSGRSILTSYEEIGQVITL